MMNQNLKQLIYGTLLLGGGLFIGKMIGAAQVYKETSVEVTELYFQGASVNLNLHLKLLDLLRSNEREKVIGKLESLIDCDLIALAGYPDVPENIRSPEILKLIEKAKTYRAKHPSAPPQSQ